MKSSTPLVSLALIAFAAVGGVYAQPSQNSAANEIIALEKGALDRWSKGNPQGFYDIMSEGVTYFDPTTEKRVEDLAALKVLFARFAGKFTIDRVEMLNPQVDFSGDLAVLTFNLVDYGAQMNGGPKATSRWNSTEVYRRISGKWKIVHSHWSYTKPDLKPQP